MHDTTLKAIRAAAAAAPHEAARSTRWTALCPEATARAAADTYRRLAAGPVTVAAAYATVKATYAGPGAPAETVTAVTRALAAVDDQLVGEHLQLLAGVR